MIIKSLIFKFFQIIIANIHNIQEYFLIISNSQNLHNIIFN